MHKISPLILLALIIILPDIAFAQASTITPIENTLQTIVNMLTGTIGTSIAIIGVCITAVLFLMGRLTMVTAASVIAGIAILFGAPAIVAQFQAAL